MTKPKKREIGERVFVRVPMGRGKRALYREGRITEADIWGKLYTVEFTREVFGVKRQTIHWTHIESLALGGSRP